METRNQPGTVRDAIVSFLRTVEDEAPVWQIQMAVNRTLGRRVAPSSVRSYLNLNQPTLFVRTRRGYYRLASRV